MQTKETGNRATAQGNDAPPASAGNAAPPSNTGMAPGKPIDDVGGAGMGEPARKDGASAPPQPPEKKAPDLQDRRGEDT